MTNSTPHDETELSSHFRFGENWREFSRLISDEKIAQAVAGLERLVPRSEMHDADFLDIGCGSGLSSLAALRLGARMIRACDLDPDSVQTTRAVLTRHAPGESWRADEVSVFDLDVAALGQFGIVHSWGVLHHTGAMWPAIEKALPLVSHGGLLVLALYRKSPLCGFWRAEKRFYTRAGRATRAILRGVYASAYVMGLLGTGRNPVAYIRDYRRNRGMDWMTDVEDWLGGYPYESVTPKEIEDFLAPRGFVRLRMFEKPARLWGVFGSHCDEFVYRRI